MNHEKNQDLQNTFNPYGIDLEQFFTRVFQDLAYVEVDSKLLKEIYDLIKELQKEYGHFFKIYGNTYGFIKYTY